MRTNSPFPHGEIKKVIGRCIVLHGNDIDTDRIIPARFLKCVSFQDLGNHVFADDRKELKGSHPFDLAVNQGSSILVVNDNFGCGSSREHAPQALMRWGIRAVIGQSFSEIFFGNCLALGIPCATLTSDEINYLQKEIDKNPQKNWELNLLTKLLSNSENNLKVNIETGPLDMLSTGEWDATSQLINKKDLLIKTMNNIPYLNNFKWHKE
ncbi:3-isopropylmalate dehydratase small subunit [Prochlorococcus sp. MIT 1307]|uniref:3-isopropylmalate dehydratase small subunit n=1 Tax=Prochlorococcus sp. MIT 1307 TaxID=3096219 RepID=UPI002A75DDD3|nr:3-isopropylmalate dehydratase small subunit [Prochlorococcus sp. MIT 1307]